MGDGGHGDGGSGEGVRSIGGMSGGAKRRAVAAARILASCLSSLRSARSFSDCIDLNHATHATSAIAPINRATSLVATTNSSSAACRVTSASSLGDARGRGLGFAFLPSFLRIGVVEHAADTVDPSSDPSSECVSQLTTL